MMKIFALLFFIFFSLASAVAEDVGSSPQPPTPPQPIIGIIDQAIDLGFSPKEIFLLQEDSLGKVRRLPAGISSQPFPPDLDYTEDEYLVGAKVREQPTSDSSSKFHFSFIAYGGVSDFKATPVKEWSNRVLVLNTKDSSQLIKETAEIASELDAQLTQTAASQLELSEFQTKVSKEIDLEKLAKAKLKLVKLKSGISDKDRETGRLQELISYSQKLPELSSEETRDMETRRNELGNQLKEMASATALADRMQKQKQTATVSDLQQKIKMIKESTQYSPERLAREVLELRKYRRELELELGISAGQRDF